MFLFLINEFVIDVVYKFIGNVWMILSCGMEVVNGDSVLCDVKV